MEDRNVGSSRELALELRFVLSEAFEASEERLASLCLRRATEGAELCLSPSSGLLEALVVVVVGFRGKLSGSMPRDRDFFER